MKKKSSMQMKKKMSPAKINKGLEKAAASGKLDKNPKFKAVVEKAARKRKQMPRKLLPPNQNDYNN